MNVSTSSLHQQLPIIIDIEASGFGSGSYPIEVGFVLPNGDAFCSLVRPEAEWTMWDEHAAELHHISRQMLFKRGKSCQETAIWLNRHLRGATVYSDAWGHDISWLGLLFEEANVPQLFKVEAITTLLSEDQMRIWAEMQADVIATLNVERHRASSDALVIQTTYHWVQEQGKGNPDRRRDPGSVVDSPIKLGTANTKRTG